MHRKTIIFLLSFSLLASMAEASVKYVSATGSGDGSGADINNCINGGNQDVFKTAFSNASDGDEFRIVQGTYTFTNKYAANISKSIRVIGWSSEDRELTTPLTIFVGTEDVTYDTEDDPTIYAYFFTLAEGASNVTFKHIKIQLFSYGIFADNGKNKNITISDCEFETGRVMISVKGDKNYTPGSGALPADTNSSDWLIEHVVMNNVSFGGIRIYYGCRDFTIRNIVIDGNSDTYNKGVGSFGIHVGNTSAGEHTTDRNINISDAVISDFLEVSESNDRQGDGIITEHTTSGTLTDAVISDCADAGFDNKGNWTLERVVSTNNAIAIKSYAGGITGYETERLTVNNSLLINSRQRAGTVVDRPITAYGNITLNHCIIWNHATANELIKVFGTYISPDIRINNSVLGWDGRSSNITAYQSNGISDPSSADPLVNYTNCKFFNNGTVNDPSGGAPTRISGFTDYLNDDFSLLMSSPCINAGSTSVGISSDHLRAVRDAEPDVGPYEYVAKLSAGCSLRGIILR